MFLQISPRSSKIWPRCPDRIDPQVFSFDLCIHSVIHGQRNATAQTNITAVMCCSNITASIVNETMHAVGVTRDMIMVRFNLIMTAVDVV